ncbi:hypothetical protein TrST_g14182 [Triparma strigata]|uniref:Carbohydrate esterase 2 N-terminal domain-containing protein n=1 Tax=Triparma strigata TaxID=1606541 RepID=A0A9W7DZA7_9STRA|nr:hypothetical protein TrST_g14182 [Triparma strigata]
MFHYSQTLLVLLVLSCVVNVFGQDMSVPYSSNFINYLGRFLPSPDSTYFSFSWTHSTISINATNITTISATLSGGKSSSRFLVVLDGEPQEPFVVGPEVDTYPLTPKGLSRDAFHTISLIKISEDQTQHKSKGASRFYSFVLSPGSKILPWLDERPSLHFIGDSDTAGWCSDGSPSTSDDFTTTQNSHTTWSSQLSESLNASLSQVTAVSGLGVLDSPIQPYLDNVLTYDSSTPYDWTTSPPSSVIILLGPNDDSSKSSKFKNAYRNLLDILVDRYSYMPNPPNIISVCGGSINGLDPCQLIESVTSDFNLKRSDRFKAYYTSIKTSTWKEINKLKNGYVGCDEHYNSKGHEALMSDILDDVVRFVYS